MINILGIPNLLIKIGVNNSQNKMTIKMDLRNFSNFQFLKHVHKKIKLLQRSFLSLIKFGNLNPNIIKIPTRKQMKEKGKLLEHSTSQKENS